MVLANPKLLVVENDPDVRGPLVRIFREPPLDVAEATHIARFVVEEATCGSQAETLLRGAAASGSPFDCVLLDLGLPEHPNDADECQEVGFRILEREITPASCLSLIVLTRFTDRENFVRALVHGADQFLDKAEGDSKIYSAVVALCRKARAQQEARWLDYQTMRRGRWILATNGVQQADRMSNAVVDALGRVKDGIDDLARLMEEQFLLSVGSGHDPVGQSMKGLRRLLKDVTSQCADARGMATIPTSDYGRVVPADVVQQAIEVLRPGLAYRRVRLESRLPPEYSATTSPSQIQAVVEEILFGAIESSAEGSTIRVELVLSDLATELELRVCDTGEQINRRVIDQMASGDPVDPHAWRGWGLALARAVARYFAHALMFKQSNMAIALPLQSR